MTSDKKECIGKFGTVREIKWIPAIWVERSYDGNPPIEEKIPEPKGELKKKFVNEYDQTITQKMIGVGQIMAVD